MIFDIGPFRLYRVDKNHTLDISLKCMEDRACGWEYGWRDEMRGHDEPLIEFRIGKLVVFYFRLDDDKKGCELWILGFWGMPSWGKRRKR